VIRTNREKKEKVISKRLLETTDNEDGIVSWSVTDSPDLKKLIIQVEYEDLPTISENQEPDKIFI